MPIPSQSTIVEFSQEIADEHEQTHVVWIQHEGDVRRALCTFDTEADALKYLDTLALGIYYTVPYEAGVCLAVKAVTFTDIKTLTLANVKGI